MPQPSGYPSTVWAALSPLFGVIGSIPFIGPDSQSPYIDPQNLYWDQINFRLSIKTAGDQGGTDAVNTYYQHDSYLYQSLMVQALYVSTPGFTVSSSRGTGLLPLQQTTGDFLGHFSGWAYLGNHGVVNPQTFRYMPVASIEVYTRGVDTQGDFGGELHLLTKADGAVVLTDRITLDNVGRLFPTTAGTQITGALAVTSSAGLGKSNTGYSQLYLDYAIAAVAGAITINKPAGQAQIAAGAASVVVTNNLVTANSIVLATLQFVDATLTFIKACIPAAGSFTVTGNANATANTKVGFVVINTD